MHVAATTYEATFTTDEWLAKQALATALGPRGVGLALLAATGDNVAVLKQLQQYAAPLNATTVQTEDCVGCTGVASWVLLRRMSYSHAMPAVCDC